MKERVYLCKRYLRAGLCTLGKECHIMKEMQKCQLYIPNLKNKPFRQNNKKKKLENIKKKESW